MGFCFALSIDFDGVLANGINVKIKYAREVDLNAKKLFDILFYTVIYLTLYPIVWFVAIYRYVKGDYKW